MQLAECSCCIKVRELKYYNPGKVTDRICVECFHWLQNHDKSIREDQNGKKLPRNA